MLRRLQTQYYETLHQRMIHHLAGLHTFTRKPLRFLHVHGEKVTKVKQQPFHRVVLARKSSYSDTTCLQLLTCETSRRLSLVSTRVNHVHETSVRIYKHHQLKLREPRINHIRRDSSTWQLCKNPKPHTRQYRTVLVRHEHQLHCTLKINTTIMQMLLMLQTTAVINRNNLVLANKILSDETMA